MKDRNGNPVPLAKRIDIPPLWLLGTLTAQYLLARIFPILRFDLPGGLILILGGFALIFWSAIHFRHARTPIHPRRKPTTLITDGPFAFSRNPIYLGMALIAAGWAMRLGALSALFMVPVFMTIIQRRFIAGEEFHIDRALTDEWRAYIARTRRWF